MLDECSIDMLEKYITYIRLLLRPTCQYVLVNRNGKQFQKLTDLFSALAFKAIGKYIHSTRHRQIVERQSAEFLLPKEQKWIFEDQKHSSNKKVESKNLDQQAEKIQHSLATQDHVHQDI